MAELYEKNERRILLEDVRLSHGKFGKVKATSASGAITGVFSYIMMMEDTTFTTLTDSSLESGSFDGDEFLAGSILPGLFTAITVSEGKCICFKAE